jgi:hypothetical protein
MTSLTFDLDNNAVDAKGLGLFCRKVHTLAVSDQPIYLRNSENAAVNNNGFVREWEAGKRKVAIR